MDQQAHADVALSEQKDVIAISPPSEDAALIQASRELWFLDQIEKYPVSEFTAVWESNARAPRCFPPLVWKFTGTNVLVFEQETQH